jgi:hypothetical protein
VGIDELAMAGEWVRGCRGAAKITARAYQPAPFVFSGEGAIAETTPSTGTTVKIGRMAEN